MENRKNVPEMYTNKQENKENREVKNHRILSMVLLILIIFSVVAFIVLGLRSFELIQFPEFIENLLYSKDEEKKEVYVDDRYIYEALKLYADTATEADNIIYASVTTPNIKSFLAEMPVADNMYIDAYSIHYDYVSSDNTDTDTQKQRKTEISLFKKGNNIRYEVKNGGETEEIYIINKDENFMSYENLKTNSYVSSEINQSTTYISVPNVFFIGEYLNIPEEPEFGKADGEQENGIIENLEINRSERENIAEFRYYIPSLNQREEYKVLIDAGIVTEISMYRNDKLAYEYKVKDVKYQKNNIKTDDDNKLEIDDNIFLK